MLLSVSIGLPAPMDWNLLRHRYCSFHWSFLPFFIPHVHMESQVPNCRQTWTKGCYQKWQGSWVVYKVLNSFLPWKKLKYRGCLFVCFSTAWAVALKSVHSDHMWWCIPLVPAEANGSMWVWGQPSLHSEFQTSQGYIVTTCLKIKMEEIGKIEKWDGEREGKEGRKEGKEERRKGRREGWREENLRIGAILIECWKYSRKSSFELRVGLKTSSVIKLRSLETRKKWHSQHPSIELIYDLMPSP